MERYSADSYGLKEIEEGVASLELNPSIEENDILMKLCDYVIQEAPTLFEFTNDDTSKVVFPILEPTVDWVLADGSELGGVFGDSCKNLESINQIDSIPEFSSANPSSGSDANTNGDNSRPKRGRPKHNLKIKVEDLCEFLKQILFRAFRKIEQAIEGKLHSIF